MSIVYCLISSRNMGNFSPIVFLVLFLGQYSFSQAECNIPSQFWCDNPEIAAGCGVTEQCKALSKPSYNKVQFTLYYETMCSDCKEFIQSQLYEAYQKVGSIMNLTLVPYGNEKWHWNSYLPYLWWFECKHGIDVCDGNILETCAMRLYPDISDHFPFINCVETSQMIPTKAAVGCAKQHNLNLTAINDLVNSMDGHRFQRDVGIKTDELKPPHQYLPWVTLNGVHTEEIQNMAMKDLVKLICDTYKGSPKPAACSA